MSQIKLKYHIIPYQSPVSPPTQRYLLQHPMLFEAANREYRSQNAFMRRGWAVPPESHGITCRDPAPHLHLAYPFDRRPSRAPVAYPAPAAVFAAAVHAEHHAAVVSAPGSPGCVAVQEPTGKNRRAPEAGTGDAVQQGRLAAAARKAGCPAVAEFSPETPASVSAGQTPVTSAPPAAGKCGVLSRCAAGAGNSAGAATVAVQNADTFLPNTGAGKWVAERGQEHRLGSIGPSLCGSAPISDPSGDPSAVAHHAASRGSRPEAARSSEPGCGG